MRRLSLPLALALAALAAPVLAVDAGQAAPAFSLPTAKGEAVALDKLRGKVVYVDFWASWCTSCVLSFPFMSALQQSHADKDVMVVALAMDQRPSDAQQFLQRHQARFAIATGDNSQCAVRFGVAAMPSSFLIDRQGVVRAAHQGFRLEDTKALAALVDHLANEPAR